MPTFQFVTQGLKKNLTTKTKSSQCTGKDHGTVRNIEQEADFENHLDADHDAMEEMFKERDFI